MAGRGVGRGFVGGTSIAITAPVISGVTVNSASSVTYTLDTSATVYYVWSTSSTPQTGSAVQTAALLASQTLTGAAGSNTQTIINGPTTPSTNYLHMVASKSGVLSTPSVTGTLVIAYNTIVDFIATNSDGLQSDGAAIFNNGGSMFPEGMWMAGSMYFDGTNSSGAIISIHDKTLGNQAFYMTVNEIITVYTSTDQTPAMTAPAGPTPGWYQCVGFIQRDTVNVNRVVGLKFWRNGTLGGSLGPFIHNMAALSNFTNVSLGYRNRNTPSNFATFKATDFALGKGDPTDLVAWLYNGGAYGRKIADYNFAGDTKQCVLLANWIGARVGNAGNAVVASETGILDSVGNYDSMTPTGTPKWFATAPLFEASSATASVTSVTVPSGATNTLTVVASIPVGRVWPTVTVDLAKIDVNPTTGMGPLTATGSSVSVAANVATFTINLSRSVYASEVLPYSFATDWVYASTITSIAAAGSVTNSSPTADPANWPGISHNGVGWGFTTPTPAGYYADGIPWATSGVSIASEHPARTTFGGKAVHGAMVNPARMGTSGPQRFDERFTDTTWAAPPAFPYVLSAGHTAIKCRSQVDETSNGGSLSPYHPVWIAEYGAIHARASAPAANEFAPPIVYTTPGSRPSGPVIDTTVLTLPSYSTVGHTNKPAGGITAALTRMAKFNPAPVLFQGVESKRKASPAGFTYADGYGRDLVIAINESGLFMVADDAVATRRVLAKRFIMHGVQWYHDVKDSSLGGWAADGGTNQGTLLPIALYLAWSGQNAALGTLATDVGGNELLQVSQLDSTMITAMNAVNPLTLSPNVYHVAGDYEWFKKGYSQISNPASLYDPTSGSSYRDKYEPAGELMTLHACGFVHSAAAWQAFKGYNVRANLASNPSFDDYPSTFGSTWESQFWTSHWTTINAVSQTVG